ncbi:hypothetical protein HYPSUDRAFT_59709 [Hypholoma sublateritium FD-334 SS-4]|uniref:Uncharacterized protein n=1 Tax=Hypholoma sublateritium (strain FD-334 SS-4) TaxID=945553 RepID=A0A0D2NB26_HYPSF|nr:hypothetical protein HYPSUDRAFT_59709 [Hypholoma sublateritium FD-334 SS-4]
MKFTPSSSIERSEFPQKYLMAVRKLDFGDGGETYRHSLVVIANFAQKRFPNSMEYIAQEKSRISEQLEKENEESKQSESSSTETNQYKSNHPKSESKEPESKQSTVIGRDHVVLAVAHARGVSTDSLSKECGDREDEAAQYVFVWAASAYRSTAPQQIPVPNVIFQWSTQVETVGNGASAGAQTPKT